MSNYVKIITPETDDKPLAEAFKFELAGDKFEIPALTDRTAPLELMPILLLAMADHVDEDAKVRAGVALLQWMQKDQPKLWRTLKRQPNALAWVQGLLEAWIEHSGIDPKASRSSY